MNVTPFMYKFKSSKKKSELFSILIWFCALLAYDTTHIRSSSFCYVFSFEIPFTSGFLFYYILTFVNILNIFFVQMSYVS